MLQEDGLDGRVGGLGGRAEAIAPGGRESQGERVRRSLVTLDNALPAIALPDGVHCRSFTGASSCWKPRPFHAQHSHAGGRCHLWKSQRCTAWIFLAITCRQGQLSAGLRSLNWRGVGRHGSH